MEGIILSFQVYEHIMNVLTNAASVQCVCVCGVYVSVVVWMWLCVCVGVCVCVRDLMCLSTIRMKNYSMSLQHYNFFYSKMTNISLYNLHKNITTLIKTKYPYEQSNTFLA